MPLHTIEPNGASQPLDEIPEIALSTSVAKEASKEWDRFFVPFDKLLASEIVNADFEADGFDPVPGVKWEWTHDRKTYRNVSTNYTLRAKRVVRLRDELVTKHTPAVDRLAVDLRTGKITIQDFTRGMQQRIKRIYTQQWSLGKGGVNAMTDNDLVSLRNQLDTQYGFLQNFSEQLRRGELSFRQARNRSEMYMQSSTQAFERGKASSYQLELPEYPADGNQRCRARCKCHWEFDTDDNGFPIAYWVINSAGKHCSSCLANRQFWNPFRG